MFCSLSAAIYVGRFTLFHFHHLTISTWFDFGKTASAAVYFVHSRVCCVAQLVQSVIEAD